MRTQLWCKMVANPLVLGYACFALMAYYAIFYLPYHFPPTQRLISDSYVFGFNNSVAIISIVTLLATATLMRFLHQRRQQHQANSSLPYCDGAGDTSRIPPSRYWLLALVYLLFTVAIYWRAQTAQFYSVDWESSHFLWDLKLMEIHGLRPYVDFKFDYGPALIYAPAYFHRLLNAWSVSHGVSYYTFHYLIDLLGLYCIFSLLNRSIMPLRYKKVAFGILAVACLAPYMGLNGIAARFLIPYLSLVIVHQKMAQTGEAALRLRLLMVFILVFLATMINMFISAEIGVAFSIALIAYNVSFSRTDLRAVITAVSAFALALVLCRMLLPSSYYESLLSFSKGANNFPLLPAAHLLLYIVTLFLAIPRLILDGIRHEHTSAPLLFALGVLSIALLPGAFGRCDPPHVFFYGLGISLIMFILMANTSRKHFLLYSVAYICVSIIGLQWSNARVFNISYKSVLPEVLVLTVTSKLGFEGGREKHKLEEQQTTERGGDASVLSHLRVLDRYPQLGLPFGNYGIDKVTEHYLWMHKKIAPEYYLGAVGVYTETDLSRKLRDISRNEYLLWLNLSWLKRYWDFDESRDTCRERLDYIRRSFIYPVILSCKQEGLDTHLEISRHIINSYHIVETAGDYLILKRID
jgi:hypothetical protein